MKIYTKIGQLRKELAENRSLGKIIGLVPTMGALHEGHLTLIEEAAKNCDLVVCSIFVNPTQFNEPLDFQKYPRPIENDKRKLIAASCDILFEPNVEEVYPIPDTNIYNLGNIMHVLEGAYRPGHFNGVVSVVKRLLEITEPDFAFFGEKDFQQVMVIKQMAEKFEFKTKIISCPTIREPSGLAMSSRNQLLNPEEREQALVISQTLHKAKEMVNSHSPASIKAWATEFLTSHPFLNLEYFEIVNSRTLEPIENISTDMDAVALIAARIGGVRLIDNIKLTSRTQP